MQWLSAKSGIDQYKASQREKVNVTPETLVEYASKSVQVFNTGHPEVVTSPKFDFIKSNLKGYYYTIHCDICNKRCRKVYSVTLPIEGQSYLKLLCYKCAGVKYKRKTVAEKFGLKLLRNPELLLEINIERLTGKNLMAFMEAQFLLDTIREKAENKAFALGYHPYPVTPDFDE